jgi:hypothetical protein
MAPYKPKYDPATGTWSHPVTLEEQRSAAATDSNFLNNTMIGPILDVAGSIIDPAKQGTAEANRVMYANSDRSAGTLNAFAGAQTPGLMAGAVRQQAANPYSTATADQSRAAQLALIQQMRAQMAGPSIANMQGQRALGQMGQQALMQGGRAGMLGAQGGSAGLAGDVGQARLAEAMRAQAGMGGAAGSLRGNDLQSANAQVGAGLAAQQQADRNSQFYANQGSNLSEAARRAQLEQYKLYQRMVALKSQGAEKRRDDVLNTIATIIPG